MAITNITGVAGSQDLPQLLAPFFFEKGKNPNALLRLAGASETSPDLGGRVVNSSQFVMSADYKLEAASQPSNVPGAAPTFKEYNTEQETGVVQIFQRGVAMNYDVMGDQDAVAGLQLTPGASAGDVIRTRSIQRQVAFNMEAMRNDANYSFINGVYHLGTTNADPNQMRGLIPAITTTKSANGAVNRALTKQLVIDHLKAWVSNRALTQGTEVFALCDVAQYAALTSAFVNTYQQPQSYTVAGVAVTKILTDWAVVNLVWEPMVPTNSILFVQPSHLQPVAKVIPGKGTLFMEPLAKIGSSDRYQIYGEIGLDYQSEFFHSLLTDLS